MKVLIFFDAKSTVDRTDFYPKSGGFSRVSCTDWSKEMFDENGWEDNLKITMGSEKFRKYLSSI